MTPTQSSFEVLAAELTRQPGVERATPGKKGFGAGTLKVGGKIFAMVSSRGAFVLKLPRERVASLVAAGQGQAFDPGHGRVMKEWVEWAGAPDLAVWRVLAAEALAWVGGQTQ